MTKLIKVIIFFDFAIVLFLWIAGTHLAAGVNRPIPAIPAELSAEAVEFDGVHGWFNGASNSSSCVLLLHGVRSDRTSMISRSIFMEKIGFSSLLIDL